MACNCSCFSGSSVKHNKRVIACLKATQRTTENVVGTNLWHGGSRCSAWRSWEVQATPLATVWPGQWRHGWGNPQDKHSLGLHKHAVIKQSYQSGQDKLQKSQKYDWNYREVVFPIWYWVLEISMMAHLLPTAGVAPSCDWLSPTSCKCPLCTVRSFPRVPALSPAQLAQGSCCWPGCKRAHQSVVTQAHHHTRPKARKNQPIEQDFEMPASPECLEDWILTFLEQKAEQSMTILQMHFLWQTILQSETKMNHHTMFSAWIKGIVHPKIKILSLIIHLHVVPNL